jgi:DNA-binding beta-propeller fold protein YncE
MFISNDHSTLYAAVPSAPVNGPPGAVEVVNLQNGNVTALIPVAGAHFLVPSPDGNNILVFSDNSDVVTVIATIFIGTHSDPRSFVTGFDRPVWGVFNGSSSAFIKN